MSNYTNNERRTADGPGVGEIQRERRHRHDEEMRLSMKRKMPEEMKKLLEKLDSGQELTASEDDVLCALVFSGYAIEKEAAS